MVEDNPGDIFLLRDALDHHTQDYQLDVLLDGAAAIRFVEEQREAATLCSSVLYAVNRRYVTQNSADGANDAPGR